MIVFELICQSQHRFEGWFSSADDFDAQKARGLLSCPACSSTQVEKLLTAKIGRHALPGPSTSDTAVPQSSAPGGVAGSGASAADAHLPAAANLPQALHALIDHVLRNTEDVGTQFAEEARKMHYEEAPARAIRGVTTPQEAEDLREEGIDVVPLPIPSRNDWN
jgi:hypothetical protein